LLTPGYLLALLQTLIKWIISGQSAVEQMRQWQQALQAEQIITLGLGGSPHYQHFKSLKQRKEA